jgi:hypothetical protein
VAATFGWFAWRLGQGVPLELVRTETFTVLAMCQWFNVLNCQSATRLGAGLRMCATAGCWRADAVGGCCRRWCCTHRR